MNRPGNHEITTADLDLGELPYALPLEGWSGMTLHCQVDGIGPSDRHPDLVKLEVSFPPAARSRPKSPRDLAESGESRRDLPISPKDRHNEGCC